MYTVLINQDKSLSTSVREKLIGGNTNGVQFLLQAPQSEVEDEGEPTVTYIYSADIHYRIHGCEKADVLITDNELYKGRIRFVLPSSVAFWNNRGQIEYWLDISIETITTYKDESTGQPVVVRNIEYFVTEPTTLLIEEVPFGGRCKWRCNPNTIFVTRGDTKDIKIALTDDDGFPYEPIDGEELWFRVKKSAYAEDTLIERQIDPSTLSFALDETDTENLEFGEYRYEVELITLDDSHYTVIKDTPFIIGKELG